MHDRETRPLNEALDREIEEMLAVEPSAAFESRVRARVAERERAAASWHWWGAAMRQGVAVAAVVLLAVAGWRAWDASERVDESPRSQVAGTELHPSAPVRPFVSQPSIPAPLTTPASGSRRSDARRATAVVSDSLPPVLVDPAEVVGMRALIADVRAGRFEMVVVSEEPPVDAPAPSTFDRAVATTTTPAVPAASDGRVGGSEPEHGVADAGEPTRADAGGGNDVATGSPSTQLASAHLVRPILITPVSIEPLVESVPDIFEGAAE
jgi:hypothetical protein